MTLATLDIDGTGRDWWPTGSTFDVMNGGNLGVAVPHLVVLSVLRSDGTQRKYVAACVAVTDD